MAEIKKPAEIKPTILEQDALKEIGNVGSNNAVNTLALIIDKKIQVKVTSMKIVPKEKLVEAVTGPKQLLLGLYLPVKGDIAGTVLVMFPTDTAFTLLELLQKKELGSTERLEEMDKSALREVGNILTGRYLASMSEFLEVSLLQTIPKLVSIRGESIDSLVSMILAPETKNVVLITTQFDIPDINRTGEVMLVIGFEKIDAMIEAIHKRVERKTLK